MDLYIYIRLQLRSPEDIAKTMVDTIALSLSRTPMECLETLTVATPCKLLRRMLRAGLLVNNHLMLGEVQALKQLDGSIRP